jgi:hypothetical protein
MRSRSRSNSTYGRKGSGWTVTVTPSNTGKTSQTEHYDAVYNGDAYIDTTQNIIDELNVFPPGSESRAIRQRKLLNRLAIANRLVDEATKRSVLSDLYLSTSQVHRCTHSTQQFRGEEFAVLSAKTVGGITYNYTHTFYGLGGHCRFNAPNPGTNGLITRWNSTGKGYTSGGFYEPDWFALLDKWHETCDSVMPSSTVLGESIVENEIFVDAFKLLLNPSRGVITFLNYIKRGLSRKTRLGQLGALTRTAADVNLGYQFGVKPMINEIRNVLDAHRLVNARLSFLRANRGGYVPIRVRQTIASTVINQSVTSTKVLCDQKHTIGCISALAKVRHDLDFISDWQAYVQHFGLHKFIGLAWELIPFSFVVDWFTNAQDYVNRFTRPKFGSPFYNIRNICHSKKTILLESLYIPNGYYFSEHGSNLLGGPVNVGSVITSTYTRLPGLPKTAGSIDFTRLGTFHAINGSALLIQKVIH